VLVRPLVEPTPGRPTHPMTFGAPPPPPLPQGADRMQPLPLADPAANRPRRAPPDAGHRPFETATPPCCRSAPSVAPRQRETGPSASSSARASTCSAVGVP